MALKQGATAFLNAIKALLAGKQDKVTGTAGQVAGFDADGNLTAQAAPETGVISFNGRTGAVVPASGDYTAAKVGALPTSGGEMSGSIACPLTAVAQTVDSNTALRGKANNSYSAIKFQRSATQGTAGHDAITFLSGGSTNMNPPTYPSRVMGVDTPVNDTDAPNKKYVDDTVNGAFPTLTNGYYGDNEELYLVSENYHVHSSSATMTWTVKKAFALMLRVYVQSESASYDYFTLTRTTSSGAVTTLISKLGGAGGVSKGIDATDLSAGDVLTFTYVKDGSNSTGEDRARIYDISWATSASSTDFAIISDLSDLGEYITVKQGSPYGFTKQVRVPYIRVTGNKITSLSEIPVLLSNGGGGISEIDLESSDVNGILSTSHGGTGNSTGTAPSATKLANSRTIRTNLSSTSSVSFDGTANITPGITGTLPVGYGGTGRTTTSTTTYTSQAFRAGIFVDSTPTSVENGSLCYVYV